MTSRTESAAARAVTCTGRCGRPAAAVTASTAALRSLPVTVDWPSTTICGVKTSSLRKARGYCCWRSVKAADENGSFQPSRSQ